MGPKTREREKKNRRDGNTKEMEHFDYLLSLKVEQFSSSTTLFRIRWMEYRKVSLYGTLYRTAERRFSL